MLVLPEAVFVSCLMLGELAMHWRDRDPLKKSVNAAILLALRILILEDALKSSCYCTADTRGGREARLGFYSAGAARSWGSVRGAAGHFAPRGVDLRRSCRVRVWRRRCSKALPQAATCRSFRGGLFRSGSVRAFALALFRPTLSPRGSPKAFLEAVPRGARIPSRSQPPAVAGGCQLSAGPPPGWVEVGEIRARTPENVPTARRRPRLRGFWE
jgi:hypothetical protein